MDFTRHPHLLADLSAGAPSTRGEHRWSSLTRPAEDPAAEPTIFWRCDIVAVANDAVIFAVVGIATPEITQLLAVGDMILITVEEPGADADALEEVLVEMPPCPEH